MTEATAVDHSHLFENAAVSHVTGPHSEKAVAW